MNKPQAPLNNTLRFFKWEKPNPITQEEAEARLNQEGFQSFCWYDVPGTIYPRHRHIYDECIWVLKGEIRFSIADEVHVLRNGDRLYLDAKTPHTAKVPEDSSVTFLVGKKAASSTK